MKWKLKNSSYIKKIALFPITIGTERRWLETVYIYRSGGFMGVRTSFVSKEVYEEAQRDRGFTSLFNRKKGE